MTPPRSSLWRRDHAHTREVWAKVTPGKRRPHEERADELMARLRYGGFEVREGR